jgi:Nucleoside-diphosphate-sugar epimerases
MRVAITGGGGFIGQATVRYAHETGHDAWSFDRADGNDIMGELDCLKGAECVIHLAGVLGTHELFTTIQAAIDINVTGAYRIMDWCLNNDASYVSITMPDAFPSIYTATKIAAQRLATALYHSRGLRVSHVRAFNAYGPGQKHGPGHPQKIIPTFASNAWRQIPIPIWGDGTQTVDLIHVDDVAKILVKAMYLTDNEVVDAGTGTALSVNQVADFVLQVAKSSGSVEYLDMRDGETPTKVVADGEGWDLINYQPYFSWPQLAETVRWYRGR